MWLGSVAAVYIMTEMLYSDNLSMRCKKANLERRCLVNLTAATKGTTGL